MKQRFALRFSIEARMWDCPFLPTMRDVGAVHAKRTTESHSNLYRCDEKGFTIWISSPVSTGNKSRPREQEIQVESLSDLGMKGNQTMQEILEALLRRYKHFEAEVIDQKKQLSEQFVSPKSDRAGG